ncbi:MAG: L-lysine 2,3-aminomutase [Chlamydiales bacterium]|nr:L-lysine 2,3-aminomutase [Chlamydiales bacterium]
MTWQQALRSSITSWEELCSLLEIDLPKIQNLRFPLLLPLRLVEKMEKGNLEDPLFKQFVPQQAEGRPSSLFLADPVGDQQARCAPKGLKKYAQRLLLVTTGACAMHCRYCFRQHFDYSKGGGFADELAQMRQDDSLREIILSGGDPLSLSDRVLGELIDALGAIAHLKRLRFHTRFPIGIPERISREFLAILERCSLQTWFVIHCNHPRELDEDVLVALKAVQKLGIPVLNQAVLLKGVNDTIETLQALSERLCDHGIQPYYLHQLDRVQGAEHFEVSSERGRQLIGELRTRVSGYAVPQYVQEIAGELSKTPLIDGAH